MSPTSADTGTHSEVEVKLDAGPDFVLPDLATLPGVARVEDAEIYELDAVYFDSVDLRLARHRTTLRRRTGGADAGWHLKLPASKNGRLEVRRPLGRQEGDVPGRLLRLVRVQLRGEAVAPVARITTRRTVRRLVDAQGRELAEVADDQVTGLAFAATQAGAASTAGPSGTELTADAWREVEVELIEGDEDLLDAAVALLTAGGARPSDSSSKLARVLSHRLAGVGGAGNDTAGRAGDAGDVVLDYLAEHVAALLTQDPQVRLDAEDGIHQMRVATRRLRASLATFRPLFAEGTVENLRDELKWLGGVLGVARDAEVMRVRLRADLAAQPAELVIGPVRRRIDLELKAAYRDGRTGVIEALDGERYLALIEALEKLVAAPPFSPLAAAAPRSMLRSQVRRACGRVQRAARDLDAIGATRSLSDRDHPLHEVRKAAKRARYAAEAALPVVGAKAKALAVAMEDVQETLGNHQDAVVQQAWLRDLGMRAFLSGENAFTFGRLHGLSDTRAQHDEEAFRRVWKSTRKVIAAWPG